MVMSSFGEGVLPCVPFYRFPLKSSRSAHRLATGRKSFLYPLHCTFQELTSIKPPV
jgi:hypothetical protein